jgi:hypothetical protein
VTRGTGPNVLDSAADLPVAGSSLGAEMQLEGAARERQVIAWDRPLRGRPLL